MFFHLHVSYTNFFTFSDVIEFISRQALVYIDSPTSDFVSTFPGFGKLGLGYKINTNRDPVPESPREALPHTREYIMSLVAKIDDLNPVDPFKIYK